MDATHLLNKCNIIIKRRFMAYEPAKWEINAVLVAVSSSRSIAYTGMAFCLLIICLLLSFIIKRKIEK